MTLQTDVRSATPPSGSPKGRTRSPKDGQAKVAMPRWSPNCMKPEVSWMEKRCGRIVAYPSALCMSASRHRVHCGSHPGPVDFLSYSEEMGGIRGASAAPGRRGNRSLRSIQCHTTYIPRKMVDWRQRGSNVVLGREDTVQSKCDARTGDNRIKRIRHHRFLLKKKSWPPPRTPCLRGRLQRAPGVSLF